MDSCSLMTTCTQATPTTTGLPRAWRATLCRQKASRFLTPWMWAPSPPSPCFPHRVPSPQWTWPPVWCPLQWLGFPPRGSTTWVPLTTSTVQRRSTQWRWLQPRAHMPPRPVPTCTETPAIPAWPAFGLRQSSMPTLRIQQCRTPCLTWVPASTLWIGLCEGEKLDGNTAQFTRKSIFTSVLFPFSATNVLQIVKMTCWWYQNYHDESSKEWTESPRWTTILQIYSFQLVAHWPKSLQSWKDWCSKAFDLFRLCKS